MVQRCGRGARTRLAVPGSRFPYRRPGRPGTGTIPGTAVSVLAGRGGGGRVRSAVWFGPGRFGSGTGVTVPAGTVAAAGVSGLELRPGCWVRRWSEDFWLGSRREEGRGGPTMVVVRTQDVADDPAARRRRPSPCPAGRKRIGLERVEPTNLISLTAGGLGPRGISWRRGHDHRHPLARLGTGAAPRNLHRLTFAAHGLAAKIGHRLTQAMHHEPSRLVCDLERAVYLVSRNAVLA